MSSPDVSKLNDSGFLTLNDLDHARVGRNVSRASLSRSRSIRSDTLRDASDHDEFELSQLLQTLSGFANSGTLHSDHKHGSVSRDRTFEQSSTIVFRQFQGLLLRPVIPPRNGRRGRNVLVRVLHVDLLVLFLVLDPLELLLVGRLGRANDGSNVALVPLVLVRRARRRGLEHRSRRIFADELTDHPEGARLSLRLFGDRLGPVDPLVPFRDVSRRRIGHDRPERATLASHSGD